MSVGMFLGVVPSFLPELKGEAQRFVLEINRSLQRIGSPAYVEPEELPNPYVGNRFGRSSLDNNAAETLAALVDYCPKGANCVGLQLLAANPYRVSFLPTPLLEPVETNYAERIGGETTKIWVGSVQALIGDLISVAQAMSIPLEDSALSDEVAQKIDNYEQLGHDDLGELDQRMAWLMLYEGCRLAMSFQVALSFAG